MQTTLNQIQTEIKEIQKQRNSKEPITIVAVTKYASIEQIQKIIDLGINDLGESKVQELLRKKEIFPDPNIRWHFIGNLQSNKIRKVIEHAYLIHSGAKMSLLAEIDKIAANMKKKAPILLQINIAREESKSGFFLEELLLNLEEIFSFANLEIKGIMFIGPDTENAKDLRNYFKITKNLYNLLNLRYNKVRILSMGMSNDYKIALEEGSNLIRIGSKFFLKQGLRDEVP